MSTNTELNPIYRDLLELQSTVTYTREVPTQQEVWNWLENGKAILWTHAGISIAEIKSKVGTWISGEDLAQLDWAKHLVELRAFNETREWRLWRSSDGIKGRQRIDMPNGKSKALDTKMKLRGSVAKHLQHDNETWLLKTRNYLHVNAADMTGYVDVRFLGFEEYVMKGGK